MTAATAQSGQVVRPLKVLVPLIEKDLRDGKDAAERAGMPFYQAAGEKLLEAKAQLSHGEFTPWIKRNFKIGERQARNYMQLAEAAARQSGNALPFSSFRDFARKIKDDKPHVVRPRPYDLHAHQKEYAAYLSELEARRILASKLINAGYRVLAAELHPDREGGSTEAMARLNDVRDLARKKLGVP